MGSLTCAYQHTFYGEGIVVLESFSFPSLKGDLWCHHKVADFKEEPMCSPTSNSSVVFRIALKKFYCSWIYLKCFRIVLCSLLLQWLVQMRHWILKHGLWALFLLIPLYTLTHFYLALCNRNNFLHFIYKRKAIINSHFLSNLT